MRIRTMILILKNQMAAGIYQELGQVSKQEDIDVHALAGVVQRLLDSMPKNAKADVEQVSCIYRASLKLDAYPTEKLHGLPEDLGTRLIYCGCVVRNTLIRSLTGHVFRAAISAGLDRIGV